MKSPFWLSLFERAIAALILLCALFSLLAAALVIKLTSGPPVWLEDKFENTDGAFVHRYRLRTTGHGTEAFRSFGRFLRRRSIDELPVFWNVLRGEIRLREVWNRRVG